MVKNLRCICVLVLLALLAGAGCKGKKSNLADTPSDPAEVEAYKKQVSVGMKNVDIAQLKPEHVGKQCVIAASTPKKRSPTPPPRGAMRTLGDVSVYRAELVSIGPDALEIRAAHASGNFWSVEIPAESISSVAVAP